MDIAITGKKVFLSIWESRLDIIVSKIAYGKCPKISKFLFHFFFFGLNFAFHAVVSYSD